MVPHYSTQTSVGKATNYQVSWILRDLLEWLKFKMANPQRRVLVGPPMIVQQKLQVKNRVMTYRFLNLYL
jgi:hypothetical protein